MTTDVTSIPKKTIKKIVLDSYSVTLYFTDGTEITFEAKVNPENLPVLKVK